MAELWNLLVFPPAPNSNPLYRLRPTQATEEERLRESSSLGMGSGARVGVPPT
jgi:hypothetical protein